MNHDKDPTCPRCATYREINDVERREGMRQDVLAMAERAVQNAHFGRDGDDRKCNVLLDYAADCRAFAADLTR